MNLAWMVLDSEISVPEKGIFVLLHDYNNGSYRCVMTLAKQVALAGKFQNAERISWYRGSPTYV